MEEKIFIESGSYKGGRIIANVLLITFIVIFFLFFGDESRGFTRNYDEAFLFSSPFLICVIIMCILRAYISTCTLVVTNKRVYGKSVFGKRVDLPLDSVSAVGTSLFKGIDVGTSSGRIKFKFIKNNEKIHSVISAILMTRQNSASSSSGDNVAETLKKYKDLLDSGIITQEEFDAKKKELL